MRIKLAASLTTIALASVACSDASAPAGGAPQLSLSFTTGAPAARSPLFSMSSNDTIIFGSDSLVITRARLVLREIELERAFADDCLEEDDACEKFETGPMVVELPLNGLVEQELTIEVDPDTYDEIEFDIHKPEDDDSTDMAFIRANPEFADASIRVEGTYNGQAFEFVSDLNAEQELELNPPLVVDETSTTANLTIRIALDQWFRAPTGEIIDPASANKGGVNENLVRDNIRGSIEGFEDDDFDGHDDDDDDDNGIDDDTDDGSDDD